MIDDIIISSTKKYLDKIKVGDVLNTVPIFYKTVALAWTPLNRKGLIQPLDEETLKELEGRSLDYIKTIQVLFYYEQNRGI